jgi:hypothetical protein
MITPRSRLETYRSKLPLLRRKSNQTKQELFQRLSLVKSSLSEYYSTFFNIRIALPFRGAPLFFGHKNNPKLALEVDLGDLQNEKDNLTRFLQLHLKVSITQVEDKLRVASEKVSVQELQHVVTKFVYHQNLNGTHWVSIEGSIVKIKRFEGIDKKKEKHDKEPQHQTAAQSWGL